MYEKWKTRTEMLIGEHSSEKLKKSAVAVFGLGGVGGYVVEALARAGVGKLVLIDYDVISESNKNRQITALDSTIGLKKTYVAAQRVKEINNNAEVEIYNTFATSENIEDIITSKQSSIQFYPSTQNQNRNTQINYIVDAVDNITAKIKIAEIAVKLDIPLISSMGTGNKTDSFKFKIDDIKNTSICPLARVMRRELKKRGIKNLTVLYSTEQPKKTTLFDEKSKKSIPASISFIPSVAGLHIAGYVINHLI